MAKSDRPVLWHIPISHFNEKVRWALDWKGIEFDRRAPIPGPHMAVALWLTRAAHNTFPVLELEGRAIGDSSAIIAAIEDFQADPPLFPADPAERRSALHLEEFFDEQLGPQIRLLNFHELRRDSDALKEFTANVLPEQVARSGAAVTVGARVSSAFGQLRYRVAADDAAADARTKIIEAFDRLERELDAGRGTYLVGESFSVADLTAASLFMPLVQPPEGPNHLDLPEPIKRFREPLRDRPGFRWVEQMFSSHRRGPGGV